MTLHPSVAACRGGVRSALADLSPGDRVVVACSGGADSMAMLEAVVFEGRKAGWHVIGMTVDHGLQADSATVAATVVERMAALGADETLSARVTVSAEGLGPEAAAREARYAVLTEVAERHDAVVVLGHTRDDQAETVLLGLARGSGGRSLAGMRRAFDRFRRPLLDVARADTVTACRVSGIEVWDDPHNSESAYTRVRVRNVVLPMLEAELGPGIAATLARTADQLREDTELLDGLAAEVLARVTTPDGLDVSLLEGQHPALRRRALRSAAVAAGAPAEELFHSHVLAVDALLTDWRGQKWVDLPGPIRAIRRNGFLVFERP